MTVVKEYFKSIYELMDVMDERPVNWAFQEKAARGKLASIEDETDQRKPWSGAKTYQAAEQIMADGYNEPLEKMKTALLKIGQADQYQRPKPKNSFVGYAPNVPAYLMNLPENMILREKTTPKTKTIHLTYSFCAAAKTSTGEMIEAGINFISLVNSLEKQGYRVKIDAAMIMKENRTTAAMIVNLKEYDQQTNLLKLAFPLVHPAMLRRFGFKWLETTPELKEKDFQFGYGKALHFIYKPTEERDFLKKNGIITNENTYFCNIYQALKSKNVEDLANELKIMK
jgi:hypothetical protein